MKPTTCLPTAHGPVGANGSHPLRQTLCWTLAGFGLIVVSASAYLLLGGRYLWDVSRGQKLRSLVGHGNEVRAVAFSPDGQSLASGSDDCTVKLWSLPIGRGVITFKTDGRGVTQDYVEAYAWNDLAAKSDQSATKLRDDLEKAMSPEQIAAGYKRAKELRAEIEARSIGK